MSNHITDRLHGVIAGSAIKAPVRAATLAPVTLSGLQTLDAVALAVGDRVLVKNQTDPRQNGVYVANTGAWPRAADFDGFGDVLPGARVYVTEGGLNRGADFVVSAEAPVKVGQTNVEFVELATVSVGESTIKTTEAVAAAGQRTVNAAYRTGAELVAVNGVIMDRAAYEAADGAAVTFGQGLNDEDVVTVASLEPRHKVEDAAFAAVLSAAASNVTGAGTLTTLKPDTERFDAGGDYDPAAGVFVAPHAGRYQFQASVALSGLTDNAALAELVLEAPGERFVRRMRWSGGAPGELGLELSAFVALAAGAAVGVFARVSGEASDTVSVLGGADGQTGFAGHRVR